MKYDHRLDALDAISQGVINGVRLFGKFCLWVLAALVLLALVGLLLPEAEADYRPHDSVHGLDTGFAEGHTHSVTGAHHHHHKGYAEKDHTHSNQTLSLPTRYLANTRRLERRVAVLEEKYAQILERHLRILESIALCSPSSCIRK